MFAFLLSFECCDVRTERQGVGAGNRQTIGYAKAGTFAYQSEDGTGRIYRHDMRHHLSVLHDLAENEKTEDIQEYISSLDTRFRM